MSDIYIKIHYPVNEPEKFNIDTNAKPEMVDDLLNEFIRSQIGAGADESTPNDEDVFEISLRIDLSDDTWYANDNCGNKGLRDGIIMDVINRIIPDSSRSWLKGN